MADDLKIKPMPPSEWWPPDFERRSGNVLMELPKQIVSLQRIDERLFVTMVDGKVIDCTDLLGDAKH